MELNIRKAEIRDIPRISELLSQVLEVHAAGRPDLFKSGTTKYDETELAEITDRFLSRNTAALLSVTLSAFSNVTRSAILRAIQRFTLTTFALMKSRAVCTSGGRFTNMC